MKLLARSLAVAVCLSACVSFAETKPAPAGGDGLWQKVEDVMAEMKNPKDKPKTREEAMEKLKKGLVAFDEAVAKFEAKSPKDARRWNAKLFAATTAGLRTRIGLPAKGDMESGLKEIVAAADADKETKGDASAILVLESGRGIEEGKLKIEDWTKQADAHLKAFPDSRLNETIQKQMDTQKQMADLKAKPIELKFAAVDGKEVDLAKMRGKVVLIDFWATWCGPCVAELPNVLKAYEKLHDKGFEIVGISLDQDQAKLENFVKEKGMKWAQYFDGKGWQNDISSRFGIQSIPAMWLVDKKGMLVSNDVRGKLEELVEKALETPFSIADAGPSGSGTGFFITTDGYLITNAHVIEGCRKVQVKLANRVLEAQVERKDSDNDLALLKVEGTFPCLPILPSRDVALGSTVATLGFPNPDLMGFSPKLAKGEIAARAGSRDSPRFFQISVPVQPGNSGGALVDADGNVVGIVTAKLSAEAALATSGQLPENVNYAVKSSLLLSFLESVPETGSKLKARNKSGRTFDVIVKEMEESSAMVLVY